MIDSRALLATARSTVAEGAALLTKSSPGEIHAKDDRDFVTKLDLDIQRTLQKHLHSATPWVAFLGEEAGTDAVENPDSEYVWALDPIDGTSNFVHGLPLCAISLALLDGDRPVVGVVRAPFLDLEYYATEGGGAFCNGQPISAGSAQYFGNAIVSIGDYAVGPHAEQRNHSRFAITEALAATVERVRMFGSAALDLAWVADGRTDGCVMLSNKPWDTAAGALIASESGAVVTDSDGSKHSMQSIHTVAGNPAISRHLLRLVSTAITSENTLNRSPRSK